MFIDKLLELIKEYINKSQRAIKIKPGDVEQKTQH